MKEIAAFEAGIKLGALFHQFVGIPVNFENVELVEKTMESCMKVQPYVIEAKVRIDRKKLKDRLSSFNYTSLEGDMIYAKVKIKVEDSEVEAILEYDRKLKYPLMKLIL